MLQRGSRHVRGGVRQQVLLKWDQPLWVSEQKPVSDMQPAPQLQGWSES